MFQMTYTIRMVRQRHFIEPGLGVSSYLDFGATLFSTQWPPYGAHILQGLLRYCNPSWVLYLSKSIANLFKQASFADCAQTILIATPQIVKIHPSSKRPLLLDQWCNVDIIWNLECPKPVLHLQPFGVDGAVKPLE